ncbi:PAS domain S-box protein [bacterium]|nr:PAS domain S-box protein [bacterium]
MKHEEQKQYPASEVEKLRKRIAELEVSEDERMRSEVALWEKEERYRTLLERIPIGIYRTTPAGEIVDVNQSFVSMLGYLDRNELLEVNVANIFADISEREPYLKALRKQGVLQGYELRLRRKDGRVIWVRDFCRAVRNSRGELLYHEGSIEDITRRKETDDALATAVAEKEALLRDLQHRVKNSLAMISGLVRLEIRNVEDSRSRGILEHLSNRIKSTANLYDILYHSGSTREVRLDEYLHNVVNDLAAAYIPGRDNIGISERYDAVTVDVKKGVPFGLIVNEILTNMIKHAFPQHQSGTITIDLALADKSVTLVLRDNGVGMPKAEEAATTGGMGMRLVRMMVEQLHGSLSLAGDTGTTVTVVVPCEECGLSNGRQEQEEDRAP